MIQVTRATLPDIPCIVSTQLERALLKLSDTVCNMLLAPDCLLNYHEGVRTNAATWIPFGWLPVYDDKKAPGRKTAAGFESHSARRVRMEHEALAHVFKDWDIRTQDSFQLYWGGKTIRESRLYLAAAVVDHPQLDKFAGSGKHILYNVV